MLHAEDELDVEVIEDAKMLIRQSNKKINGSEIAEALKIKPYQATYLIKTTPLLEFANMSNHDDTS